MSRTTDRLTYTVPGMTCGHCRAAITAEVERVAGVESVEIRGGQVPVAGL